MKKGLLSIYDTLKSKPLVMWTLLLLLVVFFALSLLRIDFVEDISSFLPSGGESEKVNYAYEHLGGDNKIIINVGMSDTTREPDIELLVAAVDEIAAQLSQKDTGGLIKSTLYTIDEQTIADVTDFVLQNLPYFLTEKDYARMDSIVSSAAAMDERMANDKQLLAAPVPVVRTIIQQDPMFFSSRILQTLGDFQLDDSYHSEADHIFNREGTEAILVVNSNYPISETKNNARLLKLIDQTVSSVQKQMRPSLRIHSFGASQVSLTNSTQIKRDSVTAILLSLMLIVALLIYYYRDWRSILLIVLCISFGGLFALGLISWIANPVSLIAVGVASIIIGIAINYPIHFLSHFKRTDDKRRIIREVAHPLLIGNITTVGAFLSLLFISSPAMKDLGLFSALLLVGTILFVLIFLPHLMGKHFQGKTRGLAFPHVAEFKPENVKGLFWGILGLTIFLYVFSTRTTFDTNMHHINYMTNEQKAEFEKLRAAADTTVNTVYVVAEGKTLEEALVNNEKAQMYIDGVVRDCPDAVKKCSGIGSFIPSQKMQAHKLALWNRFWKSEPDGRRESFCRQLDISARTNGFIPEAFQPCKDIVNQEYEIQKASHFDIIRRELADNYISEEEGRVLIYNMLKVDKRYAEDVQIHLNRLSENDEHVFAFADSSIAARLVDSLSKDFDYVLYVCGIIVLMFLFFSFGRIEISIMAFLPLVIAWIWILGIMGLFNIQFNIVNIILATFIFGMGDDYSIFVTEGLIYENAYGRKMLAQFKNSILLSASIMFIGIGMLVFAKHPAMKSLAEVVIVGMLSVVLMAYVVPPIIFKWLTTRKGRPRRQPVTIGSLSRSVIGFPYFFFGVTVLTIGGIIWLRIGKRNDAHKLKYHKLLQKMMLSTANTIPASRFKVVNPHNEDFEKPAVIICNHQSHFDLLYTLSLHPKIIVLTNDWAWNTPLYRRILRNADYLPVSFGMDANFPKIKAMVDKGYSVLVFPEGTRSVDHDILRFHQGAFQLADKLGLDILPIITHGIGDMFPKHDTCIHRGDVTVTIRERVSPDDETFRKGKTYLETARAFRQYYIAEFGKLKETCETPEYLHDIVYHNYIYKGSLVEARCNSKLSMKQFIVDEFENVPDGSRVLYKNCGNGELSLLVALWKKHIHVTACDSDADGIAIASHCFSVPANLTYCTEMPDEKDFDIVFDEKEL